MRKIIKDRQIIEDGCLHLEDDAALESGQQVTISLGRFLSEGAPAGVGVRIAPEDDAWTLGEHLEGVSLIAIEFPKFADGRGYSHARILRDHLGYKGELRALGDVLRDQLYVMSRCGFNAFEVRADKDIEDALGAFDTFSVRYQGAVDEPLPEFRRPKAPARDVA